MAELKSSPSMWLSITLIFITLVATLLGVSKDIIPEKKIPSWLIFSTALLTGVGGVLQAVQEYRGLEFGKNTGGLSEGIPANAEAPSKRLTEKEEKLYTTLKEEASRFRSSQIKLFFSPSLNSESLYNLGLVAFNQRDFAEAEKNLKYALQLDNNNLKAFNLLLQLYQSTAMMHFVQGDIQKAETYLREAERLISDFPTEGNLKTVTLLGYLYKSLGQVYEKEDPTLSEQYWERAGDIFTMVLTRKPENAGALNGLGNVLAHNGNFRAALEKYQAALKLNDEYTAAANDAALACEALMKQELEKVDIWRKQAIYYWELALELSSKDPQFNDPNYQNKVRRIIQSLRNRQ